VALKGQMDILAVKEVEEKGTTAVGVEENGRRSEVGVEEGKMR
jgi:hypothetical protein